MAAKQVNPLVKVTQVRDTRAYDQAVAVTRRDPMELEESVRALCKRFGIPVDMPARDRAIVLSKAIAGAGGCGGGWRANKAAGGARDD
jgi:hypothetical protein